MISKMADLESEFDFSSGEALDRLLSSCSQAKPFLSSTVKSTEFLEYVLIKVMPQFYLLPDLPGMDVKDKLIQLTAELAVCTGTLEDPETATKNLFDRLIDYLPLPPQSVSEDGAVLHEVPNLEFTKVECLMFAFHAVARQAESFLKSDEERMKDFRTRLQYLARGVQGYISKLKEFLAKPPAGTKPEDLNIKKIALRTNENIQMMIRDLFHSPPIYKASITLSFKPKEQKSSPVKAGDKRKPITFSGSGKVSGEGAGGKRRNLYMDSVGRGSPKTGVSNYKPGKTVRPSGHYAPPSGKFSSKIRRASWSKE